MRQLCGFFRGFHRRFVVARQHARERCSERNSQHTKVRLAGQNSRVQLAAIDYLNARARARETPSRGDGGSAVGAAHLTEKKARLLVASPPLVTYVHSWWGTGDVHVWQLRLTLLLGIADGVTLGVLETRLWPETLAPDSKSAEENFAPVGGGFG